MTEYYSESETVTMISRLTGVQLASYVKAEFVSPALSESGPVFAPADLARIELICDLAENFDLEEDALGVVLSLIDQLHGVRAELRNLARAVEAQPDEVRTRIVAFMARDEED